MLKGPPPRSVQNRGLTTYGNVWQRWQRLPQKKKKEKAMGPNTIPAPLPPPAHHPCLGQETRSSAGCLPRTQAWDRRGRRSACKGVRAFPCTRTNNAPPQPNAIPALPGHPHSTQRPVGGPFQTAQPAEGPCGSQKKMEPTPIKSSARGGRHLTCLTTNNLIIPSRCSVCAEAASRMVFDRLRRDPPGANSR